MQRHAEPARLSVRSCLVLGGARSGKSAHAQKLAEGTGLRPLYLATAAIWDEEMRSRVALHRAARDTRWTTVEEAAAPALCATLGRQSSPTTIIVVDCLTLWLTNLMLDPDGLDPEAEITRLAQHIVALPGPVLFVSNEVGAGIVPDNRLARDFRDAQGRLNQAMAQACDAVVLVTAGLPFVIKPVVQPGIDFVARATGRADAASRQTSSVADAPWDA